MSQTKLNFHFSMTLIQAGQKSYTTYTISRVGKIAAKTEDMVWSVRTRKTSYWNVFSNHQHIRNQTLPDPFLRRTLVSGNTCSIPCSAIPRTFVTTEFYPVFRPSS